ncbi:Dopamine N-acetyltransferase [Orchesella cincta]|uniref:Dopamine N-acetyltransferase n=1 Tax=Orchesella cincta TaxID=48709 RepID=A0A1D2N2M0_ORCCI|nr:Dopamine N-acetyltransferase [Orchesella cincta]
MSSEESYKQIEGEWKDFRFRRIQPSDYEAVYEHIAQSFCRDEPTANLLGWSEEFAADVNRIVAVFLPEGLSFLAEHKSTGKIAGVRITFHHKADSDAFEGIPLNTRNCKIMVKMVTDVEEMADVTTKHGINTWAEFLLVSTSQDFRKQGLAGEFYNRSIKFLKAEGFKHALVVVTSPYTQKATSGRGFEQQSRLDYGNLMDFDGKTPVFKKEELTPDHFAMVMLKTL